MIQRAYRAYRRRQQLAQALASAQDHMYSHFPHDIVLIFDIHCISCHVLHHIIDSFTFYVVCIFYFITYLQVSFFAFVN